MIYEFGDFRLDPANHQLTHRDGIAVHLKPRVFETLHFLVEHPGVLLEKEGSWRRSAGIDTRRGKQPDERLPLPRARLGRSAASNIAAPSPPSPCLATGSSPKTQDRQRDGQLFLSWTLRTRGGSAVPSQLLVAHVRHIWRSNWDCPDPIVRLSNIPGDPRGDPLGEAAEEIVPAGIRNLRPAGRGLGEETVIDGPDIQRRKGTCGVTVRLLDVASGRSVWSV